MSVVVKTLVNSDTARGFMTVSVNYLGECLTPCSVL